jgi:hypothetical protein
MDPSTSGAADLSVVVPAVNDASLLEHTLSALTAQDGDVRLEILVPERTGDAARRLVEERFPEARVIAVPPGTTIPAMRRMAFEAATAPVVAVIEDHVTVPPDWAARLLDEVSEDRPVVGGWIRNEATGRLSDRAAYLCEYGHMLRPIPAGESAWVTGNNVAYHRSVLERFAEVVAEERWENHLHDTIRDSGLPLTVRPDIVAGHRMLYRSGWEYAGQRYLYSRAFAGMRAAGRGRGRALILGLGAFLLPPVLLFRIVKNGWGASVSRTDLVMSLPLLTLFVSAWALGEVVGAWAGPGDALGRVR